MRILFASVLCVALMGGATAAHAADGPPDDLDALSLADRPAAPPTAARPWRLYAELAGGRDHWRGGAVPTDLTRGALDFRYDGRWSDSLRGVLSNRFDHVRRGTPRERSDVNALREVYLGWQPRDDLGVDAGRVNVRHGAAWGFNPTDYFKDNALRVVVSPDPAQLRENRLGTVALRGQWLSGAGAFSATLSPRLTRRGPSEDTWSLDLGATNDRNRWLLTASRKFGERLDAEVLLHGGESTPKELGLNASVLATGALVGFLEFSTGEGPSFADRALARAQPRHTQRRAAAGATYTTGFNLSLTAEADYSTAGLDRAEWQASSPAERQRLLVASQRLQELPVRRALFVYATWKDAFVRRLDVSGFVRHDPVTHGRVQWLETRYRADRMDVALQWQGFSGRSASLFGSVPQARTVELSLRFYL